MSFLHVSFEAISYRFTASWQTLKNAFHMGTLLHSPRDSATSKPQQYAARDARDRDRTLASHRRLAVPAAPQLVKAESTVDYHWAEVSTPEGKAEAGKAISTVTADLSNLLDAAAESPLCSAAMGSDFAAVGDGERPANWAASEVGLVVEKDGAVLERDLAE